MRFRGNIKLLQGMSQHIAKHSGWAVGWTTEESFSYFQKIQEVYLLIKESRPAPELGAPQPPIQRVPGYKSVVT